MLFSSLLFLFVFLPLVLALYFISPWRMKNLMLFLSSLIFYAWGEPVYIVIMLISTITDYSFGLLLGRPGLSAVQRKWIVISSMVINLGLLSYFKYADFLIANVNGLLGTHIPLTELPLPIGISFYTFQSMSYIIDVYRGTAKAQRNWIDFGTFVALFPQLVAGPIVQYNSIAEQLRGRTVNIGKFAQGVRRFTVGLAKKVLLANNIGLLWDTISRSDLDNLPMLTAWLGILAFAFQIYFDFSGYSDMAIGLGLMLGFEFNENFNKPYTAQSITDFWRRWHISLSSWFRDYVYIPLGGNRRGLGIQIRNILIVWILTGVWHGASWNFMLWGLYFGVILIFEKWWGLGLLSRLPRFIRHLYAILLILVGWVLFAFEELPTMLSYIQAMAGLNHQPLLDSTTVYFAYTNAILLIVLVMASIPRKPMIKHEARHLFSLIGYGLLFFLSVAYLVEATFNPFLYFRF
ncbi:MBOAT family O-acyltransferase [Paenibacillus dakarensis]|uniref:MBOAT family O-acyltransferase n=1 Tax=Paenibacillus dakarensis TaxID=1527293 RepID=UPI0006D595D0|nr:MBOAT family O-acyltransferase [Paenibacillus dakarensis]